MRWIRLLIACVLLAGGGMVMTGCHEDATDVCTIYKPHDGDVLTYAAWDGPADPSDYGGRYTCSARHPTGYYHHYCVYPPEHYPPPDNHWAWGACSF